ncbi:unnamed protein product, partial [Musa acuminata subsp. burmannicoides]
MFLERETPKSNTNSSSQPKHQHGVATSESTSTNTWETPSPEQGFWQRQRLLATQAEQYQQECTRDC